MAFADTTAPVLTSLTLPGTIDVTSGGRSLSFTVGATDAGLGVDHVSIFFDKSWQDGSSNTNLIYTYSSNDSFSDGLSTNRFFIDPLSAAGTYTIRSLYVYDKAGNSTTYTGSQLGSMGYSEQLCHIEQ